MDSLPRSRFRHSVPTIYQGRDFALAGGLMPKRDNLKFQGGKPGLKDS